MRLTIVLYTDTLYAFYIFEIYYQLTIKNWICKKGIHTYIYNYMNIRKTALDNFMQEFGLKFESKLSYRINIQITLFPQFAYTICSLGTRTKIVNKKINP